MRQKSTFIYGNDAKEKNSVKCFHGIPEYGMTILGGAFPLPATPNGEKRGTFIYGNDAKAKNNVKYSLGVP